MPRPQLRSITSELQKGGYTFFKDLDEVVEYHRQGTVVFGEPFFLSKGDYIALGRPTAIDVNIKVKPVER